MRPKLWQVLEWIDSWKDVAKKAFEFKCILGAVTDSELLHKDEG